MTVAFAETEIKNRMILKLRNISTTKVQKKKRS
jgi:hypothetical protein